MTRTDGLARALARALPAAGLVVSLCACGSSGAAPSGAGGAVGVGGAGGQGGADSVPAFTEAERAALATLAPGTLPAPPADISNARSDDPAAAALGKRFFFDPLFSGVLWEGDNDGSVTTLGKLGETGKVACSGCHQPEAAFADGRSLGHSVSLAAGWTIRRSPSLLDVGQARLLMWDGRRDSLFSQVFGPIESRNEMNSSRLFVAEEVFARYRPDYEAIFGAMPALDDAARFPVLTRATTGCQGVGPTPKECHGMPGDGAEFDGMTAADQDAVTTVVANWGKAMAAYERGLACGAGRFDAWVHGEAMALSPAEQRGAKVFLGKGRCADCHSGPFLSDQKFHNVGLRAKTVAVVILDPDDPGAATGLLQVLSDPLNTKGKWSDGDDGRLPASVGPEMLGALRTPTLRCVARRPSFMHTGQIQELDEVIDFFAAGGDPHGFVGKNELEPLSLDQGEKSDLVAFLRSLDGKDPSSGQTP